MTWRHVPVIPTIVVLAAVVIMVMLGFWQLARLDQKEAMIAEFARNSQNPEVGRPEFSNEEKFLFRTVRVACDEPTDWIAIAGRNDRDQTGYVHQFTCRKAIPFGGLHLDLYQPALFAVVGWSQGPTQVAFEGGEVEGVLVRAGTDFRVVAATPLAGLEPVARPDPNDLPNNHLAYAGQWFFFALTALVIYFLALRGRRRKGA